MTSYQIVCLCGAIKTPIRCSRAADFPFPTSLCHCNPCRLSTGALYSALPRLVEAPPTGVLDQCTLYASLGATGLQRYFCTRCGSHVCLLDRQDGEWHAGEGVIEAVGSGDDAAAAAVVSDRIRVTGHIFANDPRDGGVMGARPGLVTLHYVGVSDADAGSEQPCFDGWKEGPRIPFAPLRARAEAAAALPPPAATESLMARCHCGGTDLRIARARFDDPAHAAAIEPRHIPPNPTRFRAYFCACRSCRRANGVVSLQPWASVPPAHITVAATGAPVAFGPQTGTSHATASDGKESPQDANLGTSLKHFWSSPNVCWSFCARCGASVFYWTATRPGVVDVAVGILRADEGSMARRWLEWVWDDVSFHEEVVDQQVYRAIKGEAA